MTKTLTMREDESVTAFTLRRVVAETLEKAALQADKVGMELGEPALGHAIAISIRQFIDDGAQS